MAVVIFFAIMNIGTFVTATIAQEMTDQMDLAADGGDHTATGNLLNSYYNSTRNLSGDYDNVVDSLAIAAVVMAITLPLAAVVAIRKFF